jgi:putative transposase
LTIEDGRRLVSCYVEHYNTVRFDSAIGYVTPLDKLEGREQQIFADRDRKLEHVRQQCQLRRRAA